MNDSDLRHLQDFISTVDDMVDTGLIDPIDDIPDPTEKQLVLWGRYFHAKAQLLAITQQTPASK